MIIETGQIGCGQNSFSMVGEEASKENELNLVEARCFPVPNDSSVVKFIGQTLKGNFHLLVEHTLI